MAKSFIQIFCILSNNLWLGLSGVRKNKGHDDTLPYQADLFVMDKENNPENSTSFKHIGSIWNDGWGGDSVLESAGLKDSDTYIKKVDELCKTHKMYWKGAPFGEFDIKAVCDDMAALYVDIQADPSAQKQTKGRTLLYKFDDDPTVLANPGKLQVYIYKEVLQ